MDIRKCRPEEAQAVGAFYDRVVGYMIDHDCNGPKWTYKEYPSTDYAVQRAGMGELYIALQGEEIVGAFVINEDPAGTYEKGDWEPLERGTYLICHALASDPMHKGEGIGKAMVDFIENTARDGGYKAIRLDVVPDNAPAFHLYEKCGFTYAGTYDLDRGYDLIPEFTLMEKRLV